jgi:hypothetical protein
MSPELTRIVPLAYFSKSLSPAQSLWPPFRQEHYAQLLKQANNGDFTAGEIKQLMEAINVGLNTHQVFTLQKEIDQLKADLITMNENSNGNNHFAAKGITKEN